MVTSAGSPGIGRVSAARPGPGGAAATGAAGTAARWRTRTSRCERCGGSAKCATLYSMNGANSSQHAEASGDSVSPPQEYASSFHGTPAPPHPAGVQRR